MKRDGKRSSRKRNQSGRSPEADTTPADSCCSGRSCDVNRREFLKVAGVGAASVSGLASTIAAAQELAPDPDKYVQHFVPAIKKLDPMWIRSLFMRGKKRVYRGKALKTIGMPVGGIGTGQLYLRGDGTLGITTSLAAC